MIDPIDIGVLLHRGLEMFFSCVRSDGDEDSGSLSANRRNAYRRHLRRISARICSEYLRRIPTLLEPIAAEIRRRVEELILAFLDVELEVMADERVEGIEASLQALAPQLDTVLVGTIDRLSRNPGGYTLIDYKKKNVPTRADLFSPRAVSVQMPFYIYLMELNGRSVTRAAYYSFENKRYHFVFGGPNSNMSTAEDIGRSVEEVRQRIIGMRNQIFEGNYRIGAAPLSACSRCGLKEICRNSFSVNG
jgi:ATP-dependent exoDNAse (exonuclease V) beta subunit